MEEDVDKYALYGGEDLELIFTLPEQKVDDLIQHFKDFSVIGRMTPKEDGLIIQTAEGDLIVLMKCHNKSNGTFFALIKIVNRS